MSGHNKATGPEHKLRFLLMCGEGFSSWLIRTRSDIVNEYSHAACMLADGSIVDSRDAPIVYDGVTYPAGVQRRPKNYFLPQKRIDVFEKVVPWGVYQAWESWLLAQAAKNIPYDDLAILGFALQDPHFHRPDAAICSAFATQSLDIDAVNLLKLPTIIEPWQVSPNVFSLLLDVLQFTRSTYVP